MKTIKSILCALMVAAVALSATRADDRTEMPAKVAPAKAGKTVTVEELGEILENLGYNPKPGKNQSGVVVDYDLEITSGTWTLRPWVTWNQDKTNIIFAATIMFSEKAPIPAEVILQMLKQNGDVYPASCFHLTAPNGGQGIRLFLIVPNQGVTPSVIRQKMEQFNEAIKQMVAAREKGLAEAKAKADAKVSKGAGEPTVP